MRSHIQNFFAKKGLSNFSIQISTYPREAIILIRDFIAEIRDTAIVRVYAVGGDGIAFDCLNGIVGVPNTELALIPYGSSNDFVRGFEIVKTTGFDGGAACIDVFRDLEAQTSAPVIPTDIVKHSNERTAVYSLCDCLFGIEAAAALNIARINKINRQFASARLSKSLVYTIGGLRAMFDADIIHQKYRIIADGEDISGEYATINISNIPCYGGDKNPVVTADPTDGMLDMLTTRGMSPFRLAGFFTGYLRGNFCKNTGDFSLRRVKKVSIQPESPLLMVNLDGEAFFDTESTVEVVPKGALITAPGGARYRKWQAAHD